MAKHVVGYLVDLLLFTDLSLSLYVRVRLEAFSDNSGKLQLSLQEIVEWLTAKDEELSEQLPIGGDVGAVQRQREFHQVTPAITQHLFLESSTCTLWSYIAQGRIHECVHLEMDEFLNLAAGEHR